MADAGQKQSNPGFAGTHLHGALAELDHLEQSDGVAAVAVVLGDAVGLATASGDGHRLVCGRLAGLLVGRLGGRERARQWLARAQTVPATKSSRR